MATQTETERINGESCGNGGSRRFQYGNGIQKVINKRIAVFAKRYKHGEDLWTGKPLCIESEVEIEFRPAMELIGQLEHKPTEKSEEELIDRQQDEETAEVDWDSVQSPLDF